MHRFGHHGHGRSPLLNLGQCKFKLVGRANVLNLKFRLTWTWTRTPGNPNLNIGLPGNGRVVSGQNISNVDSHIRLSRSMKGLLLSWRQSGLSWVSKYIYSETSAELGASSSSCWLEMEWWWYCCTFESETNTQSFTSASVAADSWWISSPDQYHSPHSSLFGGVARSLTQQQSSLWAYPGHHQIPRGLDRKVAARLRGRFMRQMLIQTLSYSLAEIVCSWLNVAENRGIWCIS